MARLPPRTTATREFFWSRADGWDERFADDGPKYAAAVGALAPPAAGTVLDVACGTGRAAAHLRAAVGPDGRVAAVDLTPEMISAAGRAGRRALAAFALGDGLTLPLADATVDAVLAASYLPHLPDPADGLLELARVVRPAGRLALFHPIGRRALAARHGKEPRAEDPLDPANIGPLLLASGWRPALVDDGDDRYLVLADRDS